MHPNINILFYFLSVHHIFTKEIAKQYCLETSDEKYSSDFFINGRKKRARKINFGGEWAEPNYLKLILFFPFPSVSISSTFLERVKISSHTLIIITRKLWAPLSAWVDKPFSCPRVASLTYLQPLNNFDEIKYSNYEFTIVNAGKHSGPMLRTLYFRTTDWEPQGLAVTCSICCVLEEATLTLTFSLCTRPGV